MKEHLWKLSLLKETKAVKHGSFGISLQLPASVGCGFAPIKLHYFGTAGLLKFILTLIPIQFSPTDEDPAFTFLLPLLAPDSSAWWANRAGNPSLREKPSK